jgi:undecaprenyl-diphosphatase
VNEAIERFDAACDGLVDRVRSPILDHVAYGLGSACDHSLLWHTIGVVRAARSGNVAPVLRLSAALAVESAVTNLFVKSLFRRARPIDPARVPAPAGAGSAGPVLHGMRVPITSSFPSGHAASAFLAATWLHEETGSASWYCLAAAVGASRVYVRMHHASDVIAGAALGYALARLMRVALPS